MALVLNDRVKETTTTTGTGALTLGGAVTGFETFGTGVGNSNTTYYAVTLGGSAEFEVGLGTLNSDSTTITRTTVISSSNSDNAVNFSAGTKTIFCTIPASKSVFLDASGNTTLGADLSVGDDLTVEGGVIALKNTGVQSELRMYCESSNAHYAALKAPAHSDFAGNTTLTLPATTDVIVGRATTDTLTNKTLTSPKVNEDVAVTSTATELNLLDGVTATTAELNLNDTGVSVGTVAASKTVTVDSNKDVSSFRNLTATGAITAGSFVIGSADINENDLEAIDGVTAGTVAASKAVIVDTNKDVTGFRNITLTGELDAGSLDVSGDADIDGTLEADAMTLNGTAITATATLSTGISNTNVAQFGSGVVDDDFLRVNGTTIEGRSASEVLSDIGATTAALAADEATALAIALG
jgi:cytoskeletal protein CcmA (bactofilin family)